MVVEEASVRVHMSTLRKALGEPGDERRMQGVDLQHSAARLPLQWACPARGDRHLDQARGTACPMPAFTPLPVRLTELVGREADVASVLESLEAHRLVTIAGTGGIGKTRVAIHVAENHQQQARHARSPSSICRR